MDLLVLADPEGQVDMTFEAIARRTNVPGRIIRQSIGKLCKPDVNSRSTEHEGRRLIPLDDHRDWGWQIVNFKGYRSMNDQVARREYMRLYMQKRRAKETAAVNSCKPGKQKVNISISNKQYAEEEETDTDARAREDISLMAKLCNEFTIKFPKSRWSAAGMYQKLHAHFEEALARGCTIPALQERMEELMKAGNRAPKPWEVIEAVDPHRGKKDGLDWKKLSEEHERMIEKGGGRGV